MNRIFAKIFVVSILLVLGVFAQETEKIITQRPDWPKTVTLVQSVKGDLYSAEGKKLGKQTLNKGQTYDLRGVSGMGVAVKLGRMVAVVPVKSTDIKERIELIQRFKSISLDKPRPDRR